MFALLLIFMFSVKMPQEPGFKLVDKKLVREGGGANHIVFVDPLTLLTVDSAFQLNLWKFDNNAKLRNITSLSQERCFMSFDYAPAIKSLAFSNGNLINNVIYFYSVEKGERLIKKKTLELPFDSGPTMEFRFSPGGSIFAFSNYPGKSIDIIETEGFKKCGSIPFSDYVESMFFLNEHLLLTVSSDDEAVVWDLKNNNNPVHKFKMEKQFRRILDGRPDEATGKFIVHYARLGNILGFYEIEFQNGFRVTHREVTVQRLNGHYVSRLSPRTDCLVVGNISKELCIVDTKTGSILKRHKLEGVPTSIQFIGRGDEFVVGCMKGYFYYFSRK